MKKVYFVEDSQKKIKHGNLDVSGKHENFEDIANSTFLFGNSVS